MRRPGAAAFARHVRGEREPRLVPPIRLAAAASVAVIVFGATPARAARVQPPEWTARLEAVGASELFPDDSLDDVSDSERWRFYQPGADGQHFLVTGGGCDTVG